MVEGSTLQAARAEGSGIGGVDVARLPHSLSMLIARFEQQHRPLALGDMVQALMDLDLHSGDLLPFVHFVEEDYYRHGLYLCPHFELRCLSWRGGQRSTVHDHGDSHCAVRVIEGVMTNAEFDGDRVERLSVTRRYEVPAGRVVATPANKLHQAGNEQVPDMRLVTLHLYSPPLDNPNAGQEASA